MITVLQAIAAHLFADVMQTSSLTRGKREIWQMMFTHAACSSAILAILGCTAAQFMICWLSHVLIDSIKCRWHWHNSMWVDQFLHIGVISLVFSGILSVNVLAIVAGVLIGTVVIGTVANLTYYLLVSNRIGYNELPEDVKHGDIRQIFK